MKNKTKHTPGPWRVTKDDGPRPQFIVERIRDTGNPSTSYSTHIARTYSWGLPGCAESKANAQLISAAPDLLAALENLTAALISGQEHIDDCFKDAKQAINKARGES
jgi:hypothetical protein